MNYEQIKQAAFQDELEKIALSKDFLRRALSATGYKKNLAQKRYDSIDGDFEGGIGPFPGWYTENPSKALYRGEASDLQRYIGRKKLQTRAIRARLGPYDSKVAYEGLDPLIRPKAGESKFKYLSSQRG